MKLVNLKSLVIIASSVLCATAAFAANPVHANVPFAFTARGHDFPAGSYKISLDERQNVVTMASQSDPVRQISWVVGAGDDAKAPATMVFDKTGSDYALKTIQVGRRITPDLDTPASSNKRGISATTSIAGQ